MNGPTVLFAVCHCGLVIRRIDAEQRIEHQYPVCKWFDDMMKAAGPHEKETVLVPTDDPEAPGIRGGKA
jgi:hypothetical protein